MLAADPLAIPRRTAADRVGERHGKLVALDWKRNGNASLLLVRCDCGTEKWIPVGNFRLVKSCGCAARGPRPRGIPMAGRQFGRLICLRTYTKNNGCVMAEVRCECGTEKTVYAASLCIGATRSCGCLLAESRRRTKPNAESRHPLHNTWSQMIRRCTKPNDQSWKHYGGRGITVCDRWLNDFWAFVADMGEKPTPHHSLGRIDNDGPYAPENCRWETDLQQLGNTRHCRMLTHNGETLPCAQWALRLGISRQALEQRLRKMSVEQALLSPRLNNSNGVTRQWKCAACRKRLGLSWIETPFGRTHSACVSDSNDTPSSQPLAS